MHFHISTLMPLQNFLVLDILCLSFYEGKILGLWWRSYHHQCVCVCVCVCVKKVSNRNNFRRTIVTQEGINIINIAQKLMTWKFRSLVRLNLSGWCCVRWGCNKCRRMLYIMGIFPFISVLHSKPNFKS
jgi:hypothetical protein